MIPRISLSLRPVTVTVTRWPSMLDSSGHPCGPEVGAGPVGCRAGGHDVSAGSDARSDSRRRRRARACAATCEDSRRASMAWPPSTTRPKRRVVAPAVTSSAQIEALPVDCVPESRRPPDCVHHITRCFSIGTIAAAVNDLWPGSPKPERSERSAMHVTVARSRPPGLELRRIDADIEPAAGVPALDHRPRGRRPPRRDRRLSIRRQRSGPRGGERCAQGLPRAST